MPPCPRAAGDAGEGCVLEQQAGVGFDKEGVLRGILPPQRGKRRTNSGYNNGAIYYRANPFTV
jgi:hypothetical protein